MHRLRSAYRRVDEWGRGLSRGPYALLTGALTGLVVLAFSAVVGEPQFFDAALMVAGSTMGFYWANPNSE